MISDKIYILIDIQMMISYFKKVSYIGDILFTKGDIECVKYDIWNCKQDILFT